MAHIGVIDMLQQDGFEIVEVVGCSMGAVVGGMYCSGHMEAYREWLLKQSKTDIYRLFDMAFSRQGLVKGERIFGVLRQMAGEQLIEKLAVPFAAIATDMLSRTEVVFDSGDLYKALRASTGIPGAFTPVAYQNRLFVDGGVLNPLPINHVKRRDDAIIVAVNLNGAIGPPTAKVNTTQVDNANEKSDILARVRRYFYPPGKSDANREPASDMPTFSMFELLDASVDLTVDRLTSLSLQVYPADMVVEIPRNVCSVFEFHRAAELIDIGKAAYVKANGVK